MSDERSVKITEAGHKDRKDYEIHSSIEKAEQLSGRLRSDLTNPKGTGLCFTCENAHVSRREAKNKYAVICISLKYVPVPDDIIECNQYTKVTDLSLYTMTQMATLIDVREAGGHYL